MLKLNVLWVLALSACISGDPHDIDVEERGVLGVVERVDRLIFTVGPNTATCQGAFAVDQQCLVVNGAYFYDSIDGFVHRAGVTEIIEVERTQICDPNIENSCPQDVGIYRYRLCPSSEHLAQTEV